MMLGPAGKAFMQRAKQLSGFPWQRAWQWVDFDAKLSEFESTGLTPTRIRHKQNFLNVFIGATLLSHLAFRNGPTSQSPRLLFGKHRHISEKMP
jgi:hypothetical protein